MGVEELEFFYTKSPDKNTPEPLQSKKRSRWQQYLRALPHVLTRSERIALFFLVLTFIFGLLSLPVTSYYHFTTPLPANGGSYSEGVVGEARFINPLLLASDTDRDLSSLIYSGLMRVTPEGRLSSDLASHFELSNDGRTYTFFLRKDVRWHDGALFSADDVVFTIQRAQNSDYNSNQRINWQGVEVEKISDLIVRLNLKNPYAQFLVNATMGILPKHIWGSVSPTTFTLDEHNIRPIGTGPYKIQEIKTDEFNQVTSYRLITHNSYHLSMPHISTLNIFFYPNETELLAAWRRNKIQGLGMLINKQLDNLNINGATVLRIQLPRYFALFFNQEKNSLLKETELRRALSMATDKRMLVEKILNNEGKIVDSPLMPDFFGLNEPGRKISFDPAEAQKLLDNAGWQDSNGDGIRDRLNPQTKELQHLTFKLTTSNWPELISLAEELKKQWHKLGIELAIESFPATELQQFHIKNRDYAILLFGQILTTDPDPFSFWHSSQSKDPGLNLALYQNKAADTMLEQARQALNPEERKNIYNALQQRIVEDMPAIFLYNPYYIYLIKDKIHGINLAKIGLPSHRFSGVHDWYINTNRVRKDSQATQSKRILPRPNI